MSNLTLPVGSFATLFGKSTEELLKLTQKEDGTALEPSEAWKAIKPFIVEKLDTVEKNAADKAVKNAVEKREKLLAKELGISEYDNFDDLVTKVKDKKGEGAASPELQKKIAELEKDKKDLQAKVPQLEAEFKAKTAKLESEALYNEALQIAKNHAETLGLNLPSDPAKRSAAITKFAKAELAGKTLKKVGSDIHFLDADGNEEKDDLKHPVKLTDVIKTALSDAYEPATNSGKNGNGTPPKDKGVAKIGNYIFADEDLDTAKFSSKYQELKTSGDKEQLAAYEKAFADKHDKK